jgi:hypothetical protein
MRRLNFEFCTTRLFERTAVQKSDRKACHANDHRTRAPTGQPMSALAKRSVGLGKDVMKKAKALKGRDR